MIVHKIFRQSKHVMHVYQLFDQIFYTLSNAAVSGDDTEGNENENVSIPLLMRNPLPDVEGYEKNEKLDIALRPEQVSIDRFPKGYMKTDKLFFYPLSRSIIMCCNLISSLLLAHNDYIEQFSILTCTAVLKVCSMYSLVLGASL